MAGFVDNVGRWRVLFHTLGGDRQGIPLAELKALISPVGGQLAGALTAWLKTLAPAHTGAAEVTLECFLSAVSSAVQACASSELTRPVEQLTHSVTAEEMRTVLVQWGVLGDGDMVQEEEEEVGEDRTDLLMHAVSSHMTLT